VAKEKGLAGQGLINQEQHAIMTSNCIPRRCHMSRDIYNITVIVQLDQRDMTAMEFKYIYIQHLFY
jgi:hypothetical protein